MANQTLQEEPVVKEVKEKVKSPPPTTATTANDIAN